MASTSARTIPVFLSLWLFFAGGVFGASPTLQWMKLVAAPNGRLAYADCVDTDSSGNIYVGGGPKLALVKFDAVGTFQWGFGLPEQDAVGGLEFRNIFLDSSGQITASGDVWGTVDIGEIHSSNPSEFFARFTAAGTNTIGKVFHSLYSNKQTMAAGTGEFFVSGSFQSTVTYEGITLNPTINDDAAVFKVAADGSPVWVRRLGGDLYEYVDASSVTPSGDLILTGTFNSNGSGIGGLTIPSGGSKTVYLVSVDSQGSGKWVKVAGSSWSSAVNGFVASSAVAYSSALDSIVWAGDFVGTLALAQPSITAVDGKDVFLAKVTTAGNVEWTRRLGGQGDQFATSVATDASGNIYVAGYFTGQIAIGATTLTSKGQEDLFFAKYLSDGTPVWAKQIGSSGSDQNITIAFSKANELLVVGSIGGSVLFDGVYLEGSGPLDGFVAKFQAEGEKPTFTKQPESQVVSAGMTVRLEAAATPIGSDIRFQWWVGGTKLVNETNAILTITNFQGANAGAYYVDATNGAGQSRSETAAISFTDAGTLTLNVHPSLTIFGTIGRTYKIEYSSALEGPANWISAGDVTLITSPQTWVDTNAAIGQKRIYRVMLQP